MTPPAANVSRETLALAADAALIEPAAMRSLVSMPWAICDSALPLAWPPAPETIVGLLARDDAETPAAGPGDTIDDSPDVIVLRASGLVLPRVHPVYVRWGYAISAEGLAAAIETSVRAAKAVVVLFDSPGGSSAGVAEAAARIAAVSAGDVPVIAVADHLAASAAYWLAAACTAFVSSPSGQVGSIGVRLIRPSFARMNDELGIDIDAIYRGDGKLDYYVEVALDAEGRARLQAGVDACYDQFTAAVVAGRGVTRRTVENDWGAQLYSAQAAKAERLVDEVRSAREVIARCGNAAGRRHYRNVGATTEAAGAVEALAEKVLTAMDTSL